MIFTARENFKTEFVAGYRRCESCLTSIHETNALVRRWTNKKSSNNSIAVCDEECWSNYDHNYWLERRAKKEINEGNDREAERFLGARLPKYQPSI